ncbi:MAG: thymidine phosphorylase [Ruminococcus sp.]|nr:thymidine phosphorylase [Ruminococcus sp.]
MTAYDIIMKKRRGGELSEEEIKWLIDGDVKGGVPDYQMSAFLMAVCFNSMSERETAALTLAMMYSGEVYDLSKELGTCVDKHSTGGVGDKVTLIAAPICAACGVKVPKMSGKGLGHTGGTIDKLESIPGFGTALSHEEFIRTVKEAGFAVASQTGSLVPADKKIYELRNATATVDCIPLISSSVMSKKLATGADCIVLDVKCGDGAFMKTEGEAEELALSMISAAKTLGRKCSAVITDMSKPLGRAVGNGLEVMEAAEALKGNCPDDLYEVTMAVCSHMMSLGGAGDMAECRKKAEKAVSSGAAFAALEKMTALQGGDSRALSDCSLLGKAENTLTVTSPESGYIEKISCEETGLIALSLGAGRRTKESSVDPTAGIVFERTVGDYVSRGEVLGRIMSSCVSDLEGIGKKFEGVFGFSESPVRKCPQVIKEIPQF